MKSLIALLTAILGILSFSVNADGDQPVNCQTSTIDVIYFYGNANCHGGSGHYLSKNFYKNPTPSIRLNEVINGVWYSCWAQLPYSDTDTIQRTSCEYTPKANIEEHYVESYTHPITKITYFETGVIIAKFTYSDRDGQVQQVQRWVDGVLTTSPFVEIDTPSTVTLKVTDNDGHVTQTSRVLYPPMIPICKRGGILVLCDGEGSY
jgi:hypothetical protein